MLRQSNFKLLKSQIYNSSRRTFALKTFNASVTMENNHSMAKLSDVSLDIKQPLEMMMGVLGSCEIHTIQFHAGKNKINLDKVEIKIKAEYDVDYFLGIKQGRNTYSYIDIEVDVHSKENDKKKLGEIIEKAMQTCPVASTIRLAGIKMNEKINYL